METNKVEISEYGSLLMYKIGYSSNFIFNTIKANRLSGLSIFTDPMEEPPKNLDFLVECSFLEELSITSCVDYEFFLTRFS